MRFLRELKGRIADSKWWAKIKNVKNIEIVVAVLLALIAAVIYFVLTAKSGKASKESTATAAVMTAEEMRLSEMISEISGVGDSRVMISTDEGGALVGVVVVAEGVDGMENRVKVIRCVEKATGATVDKIEIFEMDNGG